MRLPGNKSITAADIGSSMTPMIDVVFQLLIYFICTASFRVAEQTLPTTLPPSGSVGFTPSREVEELELVRIVLAQQGGNLEIRLNGQACADLAALSERLAQLRSLVALPVVLDIGPDVELGHVVAAYDTCLLVGLTDIHFAAPGG